MKYITLEELEKRKSFLTDKVKQAQVDADKEIPTSIERYILQKQIEGAKNSISEIDFLIAYVNMKTIDDIYDKLEKGIPLNEVLQKGELRPFVLHEDLKPKVCGRKIVRNKKLDKV